MKPRARYFFLTVAAMGAWLATISGIMAETCNLELKRMDTHDMSTPRDTIYKMSNPQYMNSQIGPVGTNRIQFGGQEEQEAALKRIVKKEPSYKSEYYFRGVVKLGTQEYAFALDEEVPEAEKAKSDGEESKPKTDEQKPETKKGKSDATISKLAEGILRALSLSGGMRSQEISKPVSYNRLYFDFNHNGDLTDDKVIEPEPAAHPELQRLNSEQFQFPRVDLTVDAGGEKVDYSFFIDGYVNAQPGFSYASVQLYSGAYREGDIKLDGKNRHVVLIDYNSNGRFNDEIELSWVSLGQAKQFSPSTGDVLMVDPDPTVSPYNSPYEMTSNTYQKNVSKLVNIDGLYYNLEITPAGDKLTLNSSTLPLGKVTNPNGKFNALIYGDQGVLKIMGDKDTPVAIPVGEWKLLSYTISKTEPPPKEPSETEGNKDKSNQISNTQRAMEIILGRRTSASPRNQYSMVSANATDQYRPVKVAEGETVEFSFGPPYKPVVTLDYLQGANLPLLSANKQAQLGLSLVGSTGEICTNMITYGGRPGKPEFTINDPDGKVVDTGSFEYG
jgi:hypothetical protein